MGDYFGDLKTWFDKLNSMIFPVSEAMQMAILLVLFMYKELLSRTVPALELLDDANSSWEMVAGRLMEDRRSQKLRRDSGTKKNTVSIRSAATVMEKNYY